MVRMSPWPTSESTADRVSLASWVFFSHSMIWRLAAHTGSHTRGHTHTHGSETQREEEQRGGESERERERECECERER